MQPETVSFDVVLQARDLDAAPALRCLSNERTIVTGRLNADIHATATGPYREVPQRITGPFHLVARDGRVDRMTGLAQVLNLINASELLRGNKLGLRDSGFAYSKFEATGRLESGAILIDAVVLDAQPFDVVRTRQGRLVPRLGRHDRGRRTGAGGQLDSEAPAVPRVRAGRRRLRRAGGRAAASSQSADRPGGADGGGRRILGSAGANPEDSFQPARSARAGSDAKWQCNGTSCAGSAIQTRCHAVDRRAAASQARPRRHVARSTANRDSFCSPSGLNTRIDRSSKTIQASIAPAAR